jgi:DNA processing protein
MSDLKYWLGFSKLHTIGYINLTRLINHFGSVKEAWLASCGDLLEVQGFTSKFVERFIEERKLYIDLEKIEGSLREKNIKLITLEDKDYPFILKQIYDPPITLFVKGNLEACNLEKCLAVVGSRKASHYIKQVLKKIIMDLKEQDITIISGMAAGVDLCAHSSALEAGLKTIACLGSGFDNVYPVTNKIIFDKIIENQGAVLSEYFPEEKAAPWKFPRRNRVISGLSKGTLVAEAGLNSGALITAKLCIDQGRELMCIPGMITNPNTEGTHKLIKEGAGVVTSAEDILHLLGWEKNKIQSSSNNNLILKLLDSEKKIYEILDLEPKSFDNLIDESKLNIEELMMALTTLELNGIITQLPGQKFVRNLVNN